VVNCNVCGSDTRAVFNHEVLGKYTCTYYYCDACGFLQTEEPYWLDEAYSSAIATADTGIIQRNLNLSKLLSCLLFFQFDRHGKYLDMAGGYGILTRLMRDVGFDFYWSDKYCENIFAKGFESIEKESFTALTAFEVLEHVPNPVSFISDAMEMAKTRTLIFSTELFAGLPPAPDSWWYYAFQTGQHISFYQRRTLQIIAEKLNLECYSNGSFHLLTDKKINSTAYRLLTHRRIGIVLSFLPKILSESKTMKDHLNIMGRH